MLQRLLNATNVSFNVSIARAVEERRRLWTTYYNLSLWFEGWGWGRFVIQFGFGTFSSDNKVSFSLEQRRRIANIDETEISLDGSTSLAGGRPSVHFYDPNLPLASKPASRSSIKCTGIFGSNAAHECIPPHFQLPTEAKAAEREKVRADFQTFLEKTNGRFGHDEVQKWPATLA